jgi:transposase InsO family protein
MEKHSVSERRACKVVGQPRATQRYQPVEVDDFERRLTARILKLKRMEKYRRSGCIKITRKLNDEGWAVNGKRVHRLWKKLGLQVPRKQRKRRAAGFKDNACDRLKATRPNQVWSYDFKYDVTEKGQQLKFLVVLDEFTRRCLRIRVDKSCKAIDVVSTLSKLFREHGMPEFIRSDNGPEFVAKAISNFLEDLPTQTAFVEPGSPWQNGYCESFISQLCSELIDGTIFGSILEAQVLADDYQHFYNTERLHGALDYQTPERFYQAWNNDQNNGECLAKTGS